MPETVYQMLFKFDDESPSFVHGFEMGALWERLGYGRDCDGPYHSENVETLIRMAAKFGRSVKVTSSIDGWIDAEFAAKGGAE